MKKIQDYVSDYFIQTKKIVEKSKENKDNIVVLQFFQRQDFAILSGIDEAIALLKKHSKINNYTIRYLPEGSHISAKEVVLELEGRLQDFILYEGIIDGILSRSTSVATNAYNCIQAANGKEIIFMADRSDHYLLQEIDGKAARVGGITNFSSVAQAGKNYENFGSMPHALIQNFSGDLIKACHYYLKTFSNQKLIALVDFNNDVINDSLKVLKEFGEKLIGVRVDTSKAIADKMFTKPQQNQFGVSFDLVTKLRQKLDENGGKHVKIIVSSGFDPKKIAEFEAKKAPVDAYGVGQYMLGIRSTFSADATVLNGKKIAKFGRSYAKNKRLIEYKNED
ncbi:nicotinate phosphoribosyltransferase [Mesomycoplasma conjunctivae]|uniref:nicotinate phosphoribosyltransferase n=1 Tax=Mesomycoplasma conjunctivae TaxID=45361 RepID=UPI003DA634C5